MFDDMMWENQFYCAIIQKSNYAGQFFRDIFQPLNKTKISKGYTHK